MTQIRGPHFESMVVGLGVGAHGQSPIVLRKSGSLTGLGYDTSFLGRTLMERVKKPKC